MEEMAKARRAPLPPLRHDQRRLGGARALLRARPPSALVRQPPLDPLVKLYADGALGSRGAALLEPYSDDPNNNGPARLDARDISGRRRARAQGRLPGEHARHRRPRQPRRARRLRRGAQGGARRRSPLPHRARADPQPRRHPALRGARRHPVDAGDVHQTSDMYWAGNRLGRRALLGAYAWRSLLNTGVIIPNGSDFPVER